jgi:hypothetical protein
MFNKKIQKMKNLIFKIFATTAIVFFVGNIYAQHTYKTAEFSIVFPFKPENKTQTVPTKAGNLLMVINSCETAETSKTGNYVFMTNETVFAEGMMHSDSTSRLKLFFEGSINGAAKRANGTVKSVKEITKSGYPAREVEVEMTEQKATIFMVYILRKNNFIMAQVISDTKKKGNAEAQAFLNSLVVVK